MVNNEIFGGLRSALERGESLKRAMTTLFNAGYKKDDIEEAARVMAANPVENMRELLSAPTPSEITGSVPKPKQLPTQKEKPLLQEKMKEPKPLKQISKPESASTQTPMPAMEQQRMMPVAQGGQFQPIQIVSNYGEEKPTDKIIVIVLIVILIFLLGLLATIFIFKQELINLFSSLFAST